MSAQDTDLARRAWRSMWDVVLDHDRKVAVSEALGVSWARVRRICRVAAATFRSSASTAAVRSHITVPVR